MVVVLLAPVTFAACSSDGSGATPRTTVVPTTTAGSGAGGQADTQVDGMVRVVNLYSPNGTPMALDIYDDAVPAHRPKPVISELAYGTVSKPFRLAVIRSDTDAGAAVYGVEAGRRPRVARDFHSLTDVGFATGASALVVVANNDVDANAAGSDPLQQAGTRTFYEADPTDAGGGPTLTAPSGQSVISGQSFAMDNSRMSDGSKVNVTWFVDGACATDVGNDTGSTVSTVLSQGSDTNFVVPAGSHTLQVNLSGSSQPPCSQMGADLLARTQLDTTADKVTYAFPYGSITDPKILVVPGL